MLVLYVRSKNYTLWFLLTWLIDYHGLLDLSSTFLRMDIDMVGILPGHITTWSSGLGRNGVLFRLLEAFMYPRWIPLRYLAEYRSYRWRVHWLSLLERSWPNCKWHQWLWAIVSSSGSVLLRYVEPQPSALATEKLIIWIPRY